MSAAADKGVLAVMSDAACDFQHELGDFAASERMRLAHATVAELIAERDRLANIVRSHEAQIIRMTAEAAELIERAKNAAISLGIAIEYNGKIKDTSALEHDRDKLLAAIESVKGK